MGDLSSIDSPIQLPFEAKYISCGTDITAFIDLNNKIWTFGKNENGQLGLGHTANVYLPSQIKGHEAKYISCGLDHMAFIDLNDYVWMCGGNRKGQLGLGHYDEIMIPEKIEDFKVKSVVCGYEYTLFIDVNDNLWICGVSEFDSLIDLGINKPVKIDNFRALQAAAGFNNFMVIGYHE